MVGILDHWVAGTPSAIAKRSVEEKTAEQKQQNKICGTKIGGDSWTLGVGDLKCKCKKVSGTKVQNKNSGIKIGGDHWTLGNGDPKYKCKKVSGTKMWNKNSRIKRVE